MASFAKLNDKVVEKVESLVNEVIQDENGVEQEQLGINFLRNLYNEPDAIWKQTSYNTVAGQHILGGTPFRGNFASIGYTWDENNQIFWPQKLYASWNKNISNASWEAPIQYPLILNDEADPVVWEWQITWNENAYQTDNTKGWEGVKYNSDGTNHFDTATYDWNGSSWVVKS
tara:strand:+ start:167 stop:685 length:519 start_codon:yes stop_codon:yes gene_type:complete